MPMPVGTAAMLVVALMATPAGAGRVESRAGTSPAPPPEMSMAVASRVGMDRAAARIDASGDGLWAGPSGGGAGLVPARLVAAGQEPPGPPELPPGLEPPPPPADEPALPPGLEPEDPPLPAGLEPPDDEPGLPPGLDPPGDTPGLPPGLEPGPAGQPEDPSPSGSGPSRRGLFSNLHGFWEARVGPRLQSDPVQSDDFTLAETRVQLELEKPWERVSFDFRGDLVADAVGDAVDWDQRQLRLAIRAGRSVDLSLGRQILTWGTGDLLFINDLFPKDWQSFLIGRDTEYLKAPSDALRLGWFNAALNVDVVYTPRFDPDRYLTGERLSLWSPLAGAPIGDATPIRTSEPDRWWHDDEIALRLHRSLGSWELAFYGYDGFWKSPGGFDAASGRAIFPQLRVLGSSVRGPVGPGIGNLELGVYDSREDPDGSDPFVNNSELRVLAGFEMELARELTGGFQLYLERLADYDAYLEALPGGEPREENRTLVTVRLTKRLMQQNLTLSWFSYWSPSDEDAYLRPSVSYRLDDHWTTEAGFNWFGGSSPQTFFGQFERNSNVYASIRYSF